ncbi:MAG: hypothetical protein IKU86_09870 [Thermoguttaceae bacterium]|nr:hypothetical protein [Thermoguttaceae bacterium]
MLKWNKTNEGTGERLAWNFFDEQYHPIVSTTDFFEEKRARFDYVREQLELNAVRRGANLVDEERTRHILFGSPIARTVRAPEAESETTTSVRGWSGGHANPDAAKFGKTQIPNFWTGERFMYEVSDILADSNSRWFLQDGSDETNERAPRYVCVEERFGVPIRVVAERVEDGLKCVTAFPDYGRFPLEERRGVVVSADEKIFLE